MVALSVTLVRKQLGSLVRRAESDRERVTITDHGRPVAVIVGAQELADLEDELALARYEARRAHGDVGLVPQDEVRRRLGLPRR